jgi:hypothetical protein
VVQGVLFILLYMCDSDYCCFLERSSFASRSLAWVLGMGLMVTSTIMTFTEPLWTISKSCEDRLCSERSSLSLLGGTRECLFLAVCICSSTHSARSLDMQIQRQCEPVHQPPAPPRSCLHSELLERLRLRPSTTPFVSCLLA